MNTQDKAWYLRRLDEAELDALYARRIEPDFPSAERPSLPAMHRHMRQGLQEILVMTDGHEDAAYAVCAQANGIVLVTLLAVFDDRRGGGHGTRLLALLREQYAAQRAILLEVESPALAVNATDRTTREKRIAFYERSGYQLINGIEHISFGIPLLIMALPLTDTPARLRETAVNDLTALYHHILPEDKWKHVTTKET